jgi:hypothetical protein
MTTSQTTAPALGPTHHPLSARRPQAGAAFRIRYGRLALALAGLLCLLTGVISGALKLFGVGSGWLPVAALFAAIGSVVLLRRLAVRDRRRKVEEAFRAAMGGYSDAPGESAQQSVAPREYKQRPDSPLFDAQAIAATPEPAPKALTALELRGAALAEAAASGDLAAALEQDAGPSVAEDTSWEPVEVPKPIYVEAAKAERAAPEPLDLPEAPKAVGKPSLKQGVDQTAAAVSADADFDAKVVGKGQRALSNLDDVLQRRRA